MQDLATRFDVSEVTIRHDLDLLSQAGKIRRVRGGTIALVRQAEEVPYEARSDTQRSGKAAIARCAMNMVGDNDTILLDVGTTTMLIAEEIVRRTDLEGLTVVTNGLNIALALEAACPRVQVVVTGGTLRPAQHSMVDPLAGFILQRLRASVAFIGADGIHRIHGVSTTNFPEAEMKRRLLAAANRRVVVADGLKFAQQALVKVCDLSDIDTVVSCGDIDDGVLNEITKRVEVQLADRIGEPAPPAPVEPLA
ncbi:MAG: DeoR/GlpR family DNA-binding transcription regulator [Actinomycetia bacterium]|nr:DeoR/GlpR family DNA-binding transcription regulator [Actinomycetes bacterium]